MEIEYINRSTGRIEKEKIYGKWALSLLYGDSRFGRIFSFLFLPQIACLPWLSRFYGYLQKRPSSAQKIDWFVKEFQIDSTEFASSNFRCFNDFFIRKLKSEVRPIETDLKRASLPADGRYLVFQDLSQTSHFYVKGQKLDLASLLRDSALVNRFSSGAMVVARLCPVDYHRFHFPCSGKPTGARLIPGPLFSVNPIALRKKLSILSENKRMITEIETDQFGTILYIEVGATFVGSIHQTFKPGEPVCKGDEKGYFSFGGSCLILLFEKGHIHFDSDLVENSKRGMETKALFGQSLGISVF